MTEQAWGYILKRLIKVIKVKLAQFGIKERIKKKEIAVGFRAPEPKIYTLEDALKDGALRTRNIRKIGRFEEVYYEVPKAHYNYSETGYDAWIKYITSKEAAEDWAEDRRHRLELELEVQRERVRREELYREYNTACIEDQDIIRSCTKKHYNPVYEDEQYNQYIINYYARFGIEKDEIKYLLRR